MDIGVRADPGVETAVVAGLRGMGIDRIEDAPVVVAGPVDGFAGLVDCIDRPWIAVELGGIGGQPVERLGGAISVLDPAGPCYDCLVTRVASGDDADEPTDRGGIDEADVRFAAATAGRLVRRHGADGLGRAAGTVIELDGEQLELHPVPGCGCASGTERFVPPDGEPPSGTALERAERAVDRRLGPIGQVAEQVSYPIPYYVAEVVDTTGFSDARAARYAGGIDLDWNGAFMRALGEALERYCAGIYRCRALEAEPVGRTITLDDLPRSHESATASGSWWPAHDLHDGESMWVPLEAVGFPPPDDAELDAITTGLGLGETWIAACLAGLLEVIERDACMLAWYSTFEPLELEVDTEGVHTLRRRMAGEGVATTTLVMTQDLDVPVVTAVVHRRDASGEPVLATPETDPDDWPAFAVGSAASLDPETAAERALAEAVQNWVELRGMGPEYAQKEGAIAEFGSFPRKARGLLEGGATVSAGDIAPQDVETPSESLEYVLAELETAGMRAIAARTTTRDVERLGFEGVRVIVPGAQPLVDTRRHVTDRLRTVPRELGFSPRLDRGDHPYP